MASSNGRVVPGRRHATREGGAWLRERYGLTAQEARVALRVADGDTVKEVAAALGVSVFTVRAHLRNIFVKMGINRQAALMRVVLSGESR